MKTNMVTSHEINAHKLVQFQTASYCVVIIGLIVKIGPSVVRQHLGGHYFGPSGVPALPLAAGINEGGHYFRYIFLFLIFMGP
jgi:hypothetical protein